jgi:8-oxo-dGTP pyrophosphatase MutT (NUDIX family)
VTTVPSRIDYFDDPSAPDANSLVPSANAVVTDREGRRILMIRRSDNGNWAVPGGAMDLGESIAETAVRETLEETGIHCRVTGLVGIEFLDSAGRHWNRDEQGTLVRSQRSAT